MKGLLNIAVGDYSWKEPEEKNGFGSLAAIDIAVVESTQVKLAARVVKAKAKKDAQRARNNAKIVAGQASPLYKDETAEGESSDDEGEHEEIFTLRRMNTRSQTRVSRYFTHIEVEADVEEARALEEIQEGPSDDNEEPEYDATDDEEFDEDIGGDEDAADENM